MIRTKRKKTFLSPRYILKENDEGLHKNSIFKLQEWWYYNIIFNDEKSELKNWFIVMSIAKYPRSSAFKIELIDSKNKKYGGTFVYDSNCFLSKGTGVNVSLKNSNIIGRYPNWNFIAENIELDDQKISTKLTFKANSLPMWIFKNTGNNQSNSLFGYYCVMNCNAYGNISINGKTYKVSGLGYHDHTWAPIKLKKQKSKKSKKEKIKKKKKNKSFDLYNSWDWLCIHFDNGWDMFIGKIYFTNHYLFSKIIPGTLCFTSDGKKLYDCYFFLMDYKKSKKNPNFPNVKIPKKIHIKALILNTLGLKELKGPILIDFYYEAEKFQETIEGNPPVGGIWQSQGKTYGFVKNLSKTIQLHGWANMETSRRK